VGPCSFCGRSREECAKLIAGPGVFICDQCVAYASGLSAGAVEARSEAATLLEPSGSEARCSFCGKQARQVGFLVASGRAATPSGKFGEVGTRICDECLDLCLEILAEKA
jgi:ATP-dependent Clp protease ATP-binding subunit ClpX